MRRMVMGVVLLMIAAGCGGRKSSLLLERQARGPLDESREVGLRDGRKLEPVRQEQTQHDIHLTVNYASQEYLNNFFRNERIFGPYAGRNPYYPEHLVFYVSVSNRSSKKIRIDPMEFVLVDDRGNQLSTIGVDYVTALAEFRSPVSSVTRGVLEEARPGYFGFSLPVGRMLAKKSDGSFALLKQSSLQSGYLHPGVVHDGLIAFWNPSQTAKQLRLIMANIKTNFDAGDEPETSLDFIFDFSEVSATP